MFVVAEKAKLSNRQNLEKYKIKRRVLNKCQDAATEVQYAGSIDQNESMSSESIDTP